MQLARLGWHPVRLDTAQMASNADLLAIRGKKRVSLQVKTTDAKKRHSHSDWLGFGYATGYLRDKSKIFNSKPSPIIADIVVAVSYAPNASEFFVLPVAFAEKLCQAHANYWFKVPAKKRDAGGKLGERSAAFPLYLCFKKSPTAHKEHHEQVMRNLHEFAGCWGLLDELIDKLHNDNAWPLLT